MLFLKKANILGTLLYRFYHIKNKILPLGSILWPNDHMNLVGPKSVTWHGYKFLIFLAEWLLIVLTNNCFNVPAYSMPATTGWLGVFPLLLYALCLSHWELWMSRYEGRRIPRRSPSSAKVAEFQNYKHWFWICLLTNFGLGFASNGPDPSLKVHGLDDNKFWLQFCFHRPGSLTKSSWTWWRRISVSVLLPTAGIHH